MYSNRLDEISARLRNNPLDGLWTGHLLKLRHDVARAFLAAPSEQLESLYKGDLGKTHGALRRHDVSGYPALPFEQQTVAAILRELPQGPTDRSVVNRVLAGMLYEGPHTLLSCEVLPAIPAWFLNDFLKFAWGVPTLFKEKGEIEIYNRHLSQWVSHLHANILANRTSTYWHDVLSGFIHHALFYPLYSSWDNLREIYRQRGELIELFIDLMGLQRDFAFAPRRQDSGKIRFGVLASDFAPRSETFATLPVYAHLDRQAIEVILVAPAGRKKPPLEAYCASFADRLVEFPPHVPEAVATVRALDLDAMWIAPNTTSLASAYAFLSGHRLARIQMTGGCSPATSGLRNMDVFVSGNRSEPTNDAQGHYTEKLVCIDGPVLCFDFGPSGNDQVPTQVRDRASLGIPADALVYASGTNYCKITPELEETWITILKATPGSRLLLYPFNPNWQPSYPQGLFTLRVSGTCKSLGVDGNRVVIIQPLPAVADIRAMLANTADIYLDSFPHSGMTSLIDPLLTGVPTVVLEGNPQRSKMASGALRDMGVPELITADEASYIRLAVQLGQDKALREQLGQQIREKIAKPPKFLDARWYGGEMTRLLQTLTAQRDRGYSA